MKDLPPGLPPAESPKWHNRRWRDPLGYLRVRSLANPNWSRDMPWAARADRQVGAFSYVIAPARHDERPLAGR
ncbi:hypothetical protein [Streptomyces sp. NPDC055287]